MPKPKTTPTETLTLATLMHVQPDAIKDFDRSLLEVAADMLERPQVKGKRSVSLTIELTLDDDDRTRVYNLVKTQMKMPIRSRASQVLKLTNEGQLIFDFDETEAADAA